MTRIVETAVGRLGPTHRADRNVEILGVAGAGKSTLARRLAASPGFELAPFIHARRPVDLLLILRTIPRLLPILWTGLTQAPRISWPECKLLVYVTRWAAVLRRRRKQTDTVFLLDQGPLYAIVRLMAEEKPFTERRSFVSWRREMLDRWSTELSDVIWLDAPDAVLWSRINQRDQEHRQKGEQAEAGLRFIARYRRAFESIVPIVEKGAVRTMRFDTSTSTGAQIAEAVRASRRREGNQPGG